MKKLLLTICAVSALTFSSFAQGDRKAAPTEQKQTPDERATKEMNMVAANLGLTDAQKTKFKQHLNSNIKFGIYLRFIICILSFKKLCKH